MCIQATTIIISSPKNNLSFATEVSLVVHSNQRSRAKRRKIFLSKGDIAQIKVKVVLVIFTLC